MKAPYPNLTKPLKIGNTLLNSRFLYPVAQPHFLQGPELYPADPVTSYYASLAKNGSAIMLFHDLANDYQRSTGGFDIVHFAMYDLNDKGCQNYFNQFTHMIHYYGSKIISSMNTDMAVPYTVNDPSLAGPGGPGGMPGGGLPYDPNDENSLQYSFGSLVGPEGIDPALKGLGIDPSLRKAFTPETIKDYIDMWITRAKLYQSVGFDGGMIDLGGFIGQFFRESTNHRTDEYGGSRENRERFLHEFLGRARRELGKSFLIVASCPSVGKAPNAVRQGWPLEELVELLNAAAPYVDLLHVRACNSDNLTEEEAAVYPCASAVTGRKLKDAGVTIPIAGNTTYMDLETLDKTVGSGDLDVLSVNHMFMANEKLGEILKNGNGQDLNPCILCHQCRGVSWTGEWMSHCTINPEMGMEYRKHKMIEPVTKLKKVAVIGGGPGGMKAAMYLRDRGHTPVIFEKSDSLGGQLKVVDACDFKWRLIRYRKFLVEQVASKGVEVRLGTEATPEMIEKEGFDVCIVATGAVPALPAIEGVENARWTAYSVFGHEAEVGKNVVVVGGASTAAEAAIYLARSGHNVTQICRKNIVAYELNPIRERGNVNELSLASGVVHKRVCTTNKIEPGKVTYVDRYGVEHAIACDDVVVSGGMEPTRDIAVSFHGCAPEYYVIGDARDAGNMREAIFDAYATAMQI